LNIVKNYAAQTPEGSRLFTIIFFGIFREEKGRFAEAVVQIDRSGVKQSPSCVVVAFFFFAPGIGVGQSVDELDGLKRGLLVIFNSLVVISIIYLSSQQSLHTYN
jgi:hypothetical protein